MEMTKKRSSVPFGGLILLILVTAIVGIAAGAVVGFVSQYFYLLILMPLIMLAVGGSAVKWATHTGRVRSTLVAGFFGLLIGVLIYGTYRYGDYFLKRQNLVDNISKQVSSLSTAEIQQQIDKLFSDKVGQTGFIGYTLMKAKEGESLNFSSNYTSQGATMTLSTPLTWGYWLLELLVIAGGAAVMGATAAKDAFCDNDGKFFRTLSLGKVRGDAATPFVTAMQKGDWNTARGYITKTKMNYPYLEIKIEKCPSCNTNPVKVKVTRKLTSKSEKTIYKQTLSPDQFTALEGTAVGSPVAALA